jgi:hypothetical protein
MLPFRETDSTRTFSTSLILTMVSERFGVELALLDHRGQVVYLARDTVTAYTTGAPSTIRPLLLRYAGPDTAVARITLAPKDTSLSVGDAVTLRTGAFLRSGAATSARFGFAVHGTTGLTVDTLGVVRAVAPVAERTAWIVARLATGLTDSVAIGAVVSVRSVTLSQASAQTTVGATFTFTATVRDGAGEVLQGRAQTWSSLNPEIATVADGVVRGVSVGTTTITVQSELAAASAVLTVGPALAVRVVPTVSELSLHLGETASVAAVAQDEAGTPIADAIAEWSSADVNIATVSAVPGLATVPVVIRATGVGTTILSVVVNGQRAIVPVIVAPLPSRVTIAPTLPLLLVGDRFSLTATVRDGLGNLSNSVVDWRSLDPSVATVDATGLVRAVAPGGTAIVAAAEAVADTMIAPTARATRLVCKSVLNKIDFPGGSTDVTILALDGRNVIGAPWASWTITGPGSLNVREGTTVRVTASATGTVIVKCLAGGLVETVIIESATPITDSVPRS